MLTGCSTINPNSNTWPLPHKPQAKTVEIIPISEAKTDLSGYYISLDHAVNLANNVEELKKYNQELEILVETITKYYGDKIKEYKKTDE